jgi:hypothetical protein
VLDAPLSFYESLGLVACTFDEMGVCVETVAARRSFDQVLSSEWFVTFRFSEIRRARNLLSLARLSLSRALSRNLSLRYFVNLSLVNLTRLWTFSDAAPSSQTTARPLSPLVRTLHPAPCTLHPALCTLHSAPCTLHPTPYTLHPAPYTLHRKPHNLHPTPCTLHPTPYTLHPST